MRRLLAFLFGLGVGILVVRILTKPEIDKLKRRINLLEGRVYELLTRYENDFNDIRGELGFLYRQIQDLQKTALTPETKQKVEELLSMLEQAYESMYVEKEPPTYVYIR